MSRARGQTLVMFALMLLFLSLTVMVTLGIANRVHERMEAQIATDAAAYSEAVLTARTFNAISIINRAQVGKMVAMAAVESLISWSGQVYGNMYDLHTAIQKKTGAVCPTELAAADTALTTYMTGTIDKDWVKDDKAAGQQVKDLQGSASSMRQVQLDLLQSLMAQLAEQPTGDIADGCGGACTSPQPPMIGAQSPKNMVRTLIRGADAQLDTPASSGDWKSLMEVTAAAALSSSSPTIDAVEATMGSIGDGFVNSRSGSAGLISSAVNNALGGTPAAVFAASGATGGAGYGQNGVFHTDEKHPSANSYAANAHDEGNSFTLTVTCGAGVDTITGTTGDAHVYSSDQQQTDDEHAYDGTGAGAHAESNADNTHTLGTCVVCDGIWPFFLDYTLSAAGNTDSEGRPVNTADNLWGQPVLYAVAERDYSQIQNDPWDMYFNFHFTPKGATFDNGDHTNANSKVQLGKSNPKYAGYTKQVVLSAGLAYYHRYQHAAEPPNFFNPFWRATLIPPEVDTAQDVNNGTGGDAVRQLSRSGYTMHSDTLKALEKAGYAGTELSP